MILSNAELWRSLDEGDLVIDPEPRPRRVTQGPDGKVSDTPYDTTAVDLRLAPRLSCADPGKPFTFDLRKGGIASFLSQVYRPIDIDPDGGYALQPGKFVLGITLEKIQLPIRKGRPSLAARIEGKSSFARCGLLVHFTAPTIHAGFGDPSPIVLELSNLGTNPITLYNEMRIAQLIVELVAGEPIPKESQFQHQQEPTGA
jgi:dCTP deaminase